MQKTRNEILHFNNLISIIFVTTDIGTRSRRRYARTVDNHNAYNGSCRAYQSLVYYSPSPPSLPRSPPLTITSVPLTLADGGVTKVASIYTQKFTNSWSQLRKPSSGSIGLGTITGSVGVVKATGVNAAVGRAGARGGMEGWVVMVMVGVLGVVVGGAVL